MEVPSLRFPKLGLASFRRRIIFRTTFLFLVAATLALAVVLLKEEKERSYQTYQQSFKRTQAEIVARLRHPSGQLALLNPATRSGSVTPLKPLEAMAQGRIVAASNVGGHRELIADGLTGVLFAPDDPAACAEALAALLARADRWPAMRDAARAQVAAHHDWERNVPRYQDVYQALLQPDGEARVRAAA